MSLTRMGQTDLGLGSSLVSVVIKGFMRLLEATVRIGSGFAPDWRRTRENPHVAVDSKSSTNPKGAHPASTEYAVDPGLRLVALER